MDRKSIGYDRGQKLQTALVIVGLLVAFPLAVLAQEKQPTAKQAPAIDDKGTIPVAPSQTKPGGEQLVDRIVAVVNGIPILYSEISAKLSRGQTIVSSFPAKEGDNEFTKALQDQINYELILQKVDELELSVQDTEIEAEIKKFLKTRQLTMEQLQQALSQQGMTYEQYQEDFADQMVIRKFQGRVINPLIKITDKDVESYYLKKVGSTSDKVTVTLRQIYIKKPSSTSKAVLDGKRKRSREVHKKLKEGTDFAEAAKIYSDLGGATENGGFMGSMQLSDLSSAIRKYIEPLGVGDFTDPIETPAGYYIFYLEKKQFADSSDFKKRKGKLEFELRSLELGNQTKRWITEERRRSEITLIN